MYGSAEGGNTRSLPAPLNPPGTARHFAAGGSTDAGGRAGAAGPKNGVGGAWPNSQNGSAGTGSGGAGANPNHSGGGSGAGGRCFLRYKFQ